MTAAQKRLAKLKLDLEPVDNWFAVTTNPHQETSAAGTVLRYDLSLFLPRVWTRIRHADRRARRQLRLMFPRMVFVRPMVPGDEAWVDGVSNKPGFGRLSRETGGLLAIPAKQMEQFRKLFDADGVLIPEPEPEPPRLSPGDRVEFLEGEQGSAFSGKGIIGQVMSVDERDRVHVLISLLGRMVDVQVPADQLGEPMSPVPEAGA